jgi:hypothetical protein
MAEFGTFSLKDAIAPALQVQQMQLQQAETQGVLAKLARDEQARNQTQAIMQQFAGRPDEAADALLAAGYVDAAKSVVDIGNQKSKNAADAFDRMRDTLTTFKGMFDTVGKSRDPIVAWKALRPGMVSLFEMLNPGQDMSEVLPENFDAAALSQRASEIEDLVSGLKRAQENGDPQTAAALQARIDKLTSPAEPLVTINNTEQGAEGKAVGGFFGDTYKTIQTQGMGAPTQIAKLNRLDQLLDQVDTGKFSGTMQFFKAAAKDAGVDLEALGIRDDVAPAEAAAALANEMALDLRSTGDGGGMPGAMSDKDREFLVAMTPNLAQTAEGRKLLISARKKMLERQREVARLARDYRKNNGQLDEGFFDELQTYSDANPLFSDDDMTTMETARLPVVSSPAEAAKLPPGARFRTPDGRTMRTASDGSGSER